MLGSCVIISQALSHLSNDETFCPPFLSGTAHVKLLYDLFVPTVKSHSKGFSECTKSRYLGTLETLRIQCKVTG